MTSDKFGRVRPADIFVGERQRKDLGDLTTLAGSFGDLGQLQAVRITRLGVSPGLVSDYLGITELVRKGHTELRKCPDLGAARTMMTKILKHEAYAHDEEMGELLSPLIGGYEITPKSEIPIITADFCEWVQTYAGPKFNFFHCDFPYGIRTTRGAWGAPLLYTTAATTTAPKPIGPCLRRFAATSTEYARTPRT
jgi:hypothetical protein